MSTPASTSITNLQDAAGALRVAVQEFDVEGATTFDNDALIAVIRRIDSDLDDLKAMQDEMQDELADDGEEDDEDDNDE